MPPKNSKNKNLILEITTVALFLLTVFLVILYILAPTSTLFLVDRMDSLDGKSKVYFRAVDVDDGKELFKTKLEVGRYGVTLILNFPVHQN